jgi:hypothetical protein
MGEARATGNTHDRLLVSERADQRQAKKPKELAIAPQLLPSTGQRGIRSNDEFFPQFSSRLALRRCPVSRQAAALGHLPSGKAFLASSFDCALAPR